MTQERSRDKRRWRPWYPALVTAAVLALALPLGYRRTAAIIDTPGPGSVAHALQPLTAATRIGLRGHISREPDLLNPRQLDLHVRVTEIRIGNTGDWQPVKRGEIRLHVYTYKENSPAIHERMRALASPQAYGYHVEALADYQPVAERLNPADLDYSSVLLLEGVDASLRCHVARTTLLESTRCNPLMKLILTAKTGILDRFRQGRRALAGRLGDATSPEPWRTVEPTNSLDRNSAAPVATRVDILAAGNYPLVVISGNGTADLINAGERIEGERLLLDSIRFRGATRVRNVLLPSPDSRAGIQGATALLGKMTIGTLHLPVLPAPAQTLTEAIGDAYLLEQARQGTPWARQYDTDFAALRTRAGEAGTRLAAIGTSTLADWQNLALTPLPRLQEPPPRFASSAITPLLLARIHGLNWIIVTDTTPEAVPTAIAGAPPCDVLVVPNLSHYRTYTKWMEHLLRNCPPRLLVVAGIRPLDDRLLERLVPDGCLLIQTGSDGAVSATLQSDGSTRLTTYRTRRDLSLAGRPMR